MTTDSRHNLPIAPNLLDRNFQPDQPNAVWASDITYIPTDEGWLYLAAVIDPVQPPSGGMEHAAPHANQSGG